MFPFTTNSSQLGHLNGAGDLRLQKRISTVMKVLMNKELKGTAENKLLTVMKRLRCLTCMISVNKCVTLEWREDVTCCILNNNIRITV